MSAAPIVEAVVRGATQTGEETGARGVGAGADEAVRTTPPTRMTTTADRATVAATMAAAVAVGAGGATGAAHLDHRGGATEAAGARAGSRRTTLTTTIYAPRQRISTTSAG